MFLLISADDVLRLEGWRVPKLSFGTGKRGHSKRGLLSLASLKSLASLESPETVGFPFLFHSLGAL